MADTALIYLTALGGLLLIGLICSILSTKLKLSSVLFLVISGVLLRFVRIDGVPIFEVPQDLVLALGVMTLILVVFDAASQFKIRQLNSIFLGAIKLTFVFVLFTLVLFTMATNLITGSSIFVSLIFAAFMAGTSPDIAVAILGGAKSKIVDFLELESILNTPIIVLIPFIIIDLFENINDVTTSTILPQMVPFLQQIVTGVGTGVIIGILMFKIMSRTYEEKLSPIAIVASALLTYVLAEHIGGNGVLAVTTMALIYGNLYIKHKMILGQFITIFSSFLQILVFILLGLIVKVPLTWIFLLKSFALFWIFTIIRLFAIEISFWNKYNWKEKIFMAINAPKGIATAVVIFLMSTFTIPGLDNILDYGIIFIFYSIIASTIIAKFSKFFIEVEAKSTVEVGPALVTPTKAPELPVKNGNNKTAKNNKKKTTTKPKKKPTKKTSKKK